MVTLFSVKDYAVRCESVIESMFRFISDTDGIPDEHKDKTASYKALALLGWAGIIPDRQREYYRERYQRMYGMTEREQQNRLLARYFTSALVRHQIKGLGDDPAWNGRFIQVNFDPAVPGAPSGLVSRRLYYRAVPTTMTTNTVAPWRGKGYYRIQEGGEVKLGLTSWKTPMDYTSFTVELSDETRSVHIDADYVIEVE